MCVRGHPIGGYEHFGVSIICHDFFSSLVSSETLFGPNAPETTSGKRPTSYQYSATSATESATSIPTKMLGSCRYKLAVAGPELQPQHPIVVKARGVQPSVQRLAIASLKLDDHFSFLHVDQNPATLHGRRITQFFRKGLGALSRQACKRVHCEISRHRVSLHGNTRSGPEKQINCPP